MGKMEFVEIWAEYVRTHTDKEWSKQQNILLNSIQSNISVEDYLKMKREIYKL